MFDKFRPSNEIGPHLTILNVGSPCSAHGKGDHSIGLNNLKMLLVASDATFVVRQALTTE